MCVLLVSESVRERSKGSRLINPSQKLEPVSAQTKPNTSKKCSLLSLAKFYDLLTILLTLARYSTEHPFLPIVVLLALKSLQCLSSDR